MYDDNIPIFSIKTAITMSELITQPQVGAQFNMFNIVLNTEVVFAC